MRFHEATLSGVYLIEVERRPDERGFFARSCCEREFADHGITARFPQCNVSFNKHAHTLRGMHYQAAPYGEVKLVRCTAGAIWDVVVDLRPGSPTRLRWYGALLSAEAHDQLYIPAGCAHGFLTLCDATEVFYQMGASYVADAARGFRWDDPLADIRWPAPPAIISERDRTYPDLDPEVSDG